MDYLGKAVASNTALGFATDSRNTDMMQALIRAGADVNVENGYVYLNRAILMKRYSVTKVLLAAGADMERSSMGFTALEWASLTSDEHVVELLIAAGANPNAVAPNVGTILHYVAIFHGNEEITRMLVRSGARTDIPDINGKTAVDLAKKLGRTSMLKILESSNNGRSL